MNAVDEEFRRHSEKIDKALLAVAPIRKEFKGRSGSGKIACPNCGGTLSWSIAKTNGHIWAKCDGPDCVAWVE